MTISLHEDVSVCEPPLLAQLIQVERDVVTDQWWKDFLRLHSQQKIAQIVTSVFQQREIEQTDCAD